MVGQLYDRESSLGRKSIVRMTALVTTFLICTLAYRMHTAATAPPPKNELPWVAFDEKKLIELRKAGKPVLIDFTADWCAICKQNEHIALNTMETADFVRKNEIVTMVADFTDESEEIQRWLSLFDSISVPLTVIVPPDPEAKIIRLAGPFNQDQILSSLERAMSRKGAGPGDAMMAGESGKMVMSDSQGAEKVAAVAPIETRARAGTAGSGSLLLMHHGAAGLPVLGRPAAATSWAAFLMAARSSLPVPRIGIFSTW